LYLFFPISGERTAYSSGATEFTVVFRESFVTRSLVFYILFFRLLLVLLSFFSHCVVCPSIYGFWLPLWYLQTLLIWRPLCIVLWCSQYCCQWPLWSVLSFLFHHQCVLYYHSLYCTNVNFVLFSDIIPYSSQAYGISLTNNHR
jgi:hypothetical protein